VRQGVKGIPGGQEMHRGGNQLTTDPVGEGMTWIGNRPE